MVVACCLTRLGMTARNQHRRVGRLGLGKVKRGGDVMVRPALVDDFLDSIVAAIQPTNDLAVLRCPIGKPAQLLEEESALLLLIGKALLFRLQFLVSG